MVYWSREFVGRHVYWLLLEMWRHNGFVRNRLTELHEDITQVNLYHKNYSDVKVFSLEPEQMLLCHYYEARLL